MADLNLFFPQWQGAGQGQELYRGAQALKAKYELGDFEPIEVSREAKLSVQKEILGFEPLTKQFLKCQELLSERQPETIFTVGGGCDVELAPVSYLNARYKEELSILWFDAHGDLNTPQSSLSKLFHGMPLRILLGDCGESDHPVLFSKLRADQVTLIGTRDLDVPEAEYLKANGIKVIPLRQGGIETKGPWMESLSQNVYIHVDLDVLEPTLFPNVMCPVAGGLPPQVLLDLIEEIGRKRNIVGMSLLEYVEAPVTEGDLIRRLIQMGRHLHLK